MSSKISQLTLSTLQSGDFIPVQRSTSNYRLNLSGSIGEYISQNSSSTFQAGMTGFIVKFGSNGGFTGEYIRAGTSANYINLDPTNVITLKTSAGEVRIGMPGGGNELWNWPNEEGDYTFCSREYINQNPISTYGYQLGTGGYISNSSNLNISNDHDGKIIISSNTTGITYTVASGLRAGFSCQISQTSTGSVSFTGAAGVSLNSYGGLTQIAGRYGSAAIQYIGTDSYILAGNLS